MKKLIFIILLFPCLAATGHIHPEKYYQDIWCNEQRGKEKFGAVLDNMAAVLVECVKGVSSAIKKNLSGQKSINAIRGQV